MLFETEYDKLLAAKFTFDHYLFLNSPSKFYSSPFPGYAIGMRLQMTLA